MSHRQGQHGDICRGAAFLSVFQACDRSWICLRWNVLRRCVATPIRSSRRRKAKRHSSDVMNEDHRYRCRHSASGNIDFRSPGLATGETRGIVTASPGVPPSIVSGDRQCFDVVPIRFDSFLVSRSFECRRWRILSASAFMPIAILRWRLRWTGSERTLAIDAYARAVRSRVSLSRDTGYGGMRHRYKCGNRCRYARSSVTPLRMVFARA